MISEISKRPISSRSLSTSSRTMLSSRPLSEAQMAAHTRRSSLRSPGASRCRRKWPKPQRKRRTITGGTPNSPTVNKHSMNNCLWSRTECASEIKQQTGQERHRRQSRAKHWKSKPKSRSLKLFKTDTSSSSIRLSVTRKITRAASILNRVRSSMTKFL